MATEEYNPHQFHHNTNKGHIPHGHHQLVSMLNNSSSTAADSCSSSCGGRGADASPTPAVNRGCGCGSANSSCCGSSHSSNSSWDLGNFLWYHGPITRINAELSLLHDGDFLVRDCISSPGDYVLTCRWKGQVLHFRYRIKTQCSIQICISITV